MASRRFIVEDFPSKPRESCNTCLPASAHDAEIPIFGGNLHLSIVNACHALRLSFVSSPVPLRQLLATELPVCMLPALRTECSDMRNSCLKQAWLIKAT